MSWQFALSNTCVVTNFVLDKAEGSSSATNGNFSVEMNATNRKYFIKAFFDADAKDVTYDYRLDKAPRGTVTVGGTAYSGYKIIDGNLTK